MITDNKWETFFLQKNTVEVDSNTNHENLKNHMSKKDYTELMSAYDPMGFESHFKKCTAMLKNMNKRFDRMIDTSKNMEKMLDEMLEKLEQKWPK